MPNDIPVHMEPLCMAKRFVLAMIYITGFQCTEPGWKFNILSLGTCVVTVITSLSLGYSLYISEDIFQTIQTACGIGTCAPVIDAKRQSNVLFN